MCQYCNCGQLNWTPAKGKCMKCFKLAVEDNSGYCPECKNKYKNLSPAINIAFPMDRK